MNSLKIVELQNVGQIRHAEATLGDLTVLVGPQASGKSIFLQFLKLILDTGYVHEQLKKHGIEWDRKVPGFLDVFFGEGMRGLWKPNSKVLVDRKPQSMSELVTPRNRRRESTVFYVPAQRVLSLANGWPKPFHGFSAEDPFAVRDFSETFRLLLEHEFGSSQVDLFPKANRLKSEYRQLLARTVFANASLCIDRLGAQKRLLLQQGSVSCRDSGARTGSEILDEQKIPFMAWSAGQREFVPLLMGLYWLMPSAKTKQRTGVETVILEEPEMGLHPFAVSAVMLLVFELLWRGYRVCLSTHSTHILDVVWAWRLMQERKVDSSLLLDVFDVQKTQAMKSVAETVMAKSARVYFFDREGNSHDISALDPGSDKVFEAGWGGLSEFSSRVNDVVARAMNGVRGSP